MVLVSRRNRVRTLVAVSQVCNVFLCPFLRVKAYLRARSPIFVSWGAKSAVKVKGVPAEMLDLKPSRWINP